MKILIACEFSGIVREAFKKRGHDAWSCDLLDTEIPGQHIKGDVLEILNNGWDLMIAHPPCTYLANSGVRWFFDKDINKRRDRMVALRNAIMDFADLLNAPIEKIVMENPIQHKYAREYIRKYDQIIQPWQFGHGETKATCLWLKNLQKLEPTKIVNGRQPRVHHESPGPDRWKSRSRTYTGIAKAMAEQWSN